MNTLTFEHCRIDRAPGGKLVITPVRRGYCEGCSGGGITKPLEQYTVMLDTAEVAKLKQLLDDGRCPACKGRGGFDGPEDCFDCAWCNGSGRASVEDIVREGLRLSGEVAKLRQLIPPRDEVRSMFTAEDRVEEV